MHGMHARATTLMAGGGGWGRTHSKGPLVTSVASGRGSGSACRFLLLASSYSDQPLRPMPPRRPARPVSVASTWEGAGGGGG